MLPVTTTTFTSPPKRSASQPLERFAPWFHTSSASASCPQFREYNNLLLHSFCLLGAFRFIIIFSRCGWVTLKTLSLGSLLYGGCSLCASVVSFSSPTTDTQVEFAQSCEIETYTSHHRLIGVKEHSWRSCWCHQQKLYLIHSVVISMKGWMISLSSLLQVNELRLCYKFDGQTNKMNRQLILQTAD